MDQNQQQDTLYDSYDKTLYRTGASGDDPVSDMLMSDSSANNSANVQTSSSDIGSGVSTATSPQATGSQQAGKQTFNDTTDGYFLGIVNGLGVFSLGGASSYIKWDGTTLTVVGGVNISQLDIPDQTTANSFHVDTAGNTWWGSNVATGLSGANASITDSGVAVFKSVSVGGTAVQYVITNSGIFSYGDGSDGSATCDGSTSVSGMSRSSNTYTLTRDVYFSNLTVNNGIDIITAGYRMFVSQVLTVGQGVSGKIHYDGNVGGNGPNGLVSDTSPGVGSGGAALASGYLKGSLAGNDGGKGTNAVASTGGANVAQPGSNGANTSNSLGSNGSNGSSGASGGTGGSASPGGNSPDGTGASGGTGGSVSISNVKLIANWHLATLLDISSTGSTVKFDNSASTAGGGGGGRGNGGSFLGASCHQGGSGGGGASAGGIVAIYAKVIILNSGASITGNGGKGGKGGDGANGTINFGADGSGGGGGGGGGGGNGGILVLAYNSLTNSGSITVTPGTGGAGGTGGSAVGSGSSGGNGSNGSDGSAGTIYQFLLSL